MARFVLAVLVLAALCGAATAQFGGWRDGRATFYGESPGRSIARTRGLLRKPPIREEVGLSVFFFVSSSSSRPTNPIPKLLRHGRVANRQGLVRLRLA
jgi:hypothetical protein